MRRVNNISWEHETWRQQLLKLSYQKPIRYGEVSNSKWHANQRNIAIGENNVMAWRRVVIYFAACGARRMSFYYGIVAVL